MSRLRNAESIAWQKALAMAQAQRARARTLAGCRRAFRVIFLRAWAQAYCSIPSVPLLMPGPMLEERPVPEEEPAVIDAAARFLIQHPLELERELAAAKLTSWGQAFRAANAPADHHQFDAEVAKLVREGTPRRTKSPQTLRAVIEAGLGVQPLTPSERVLAAQAEAQPVPSGRVDELLENIEYGLAHPGDRDGQRLPEPHHFMARGPNIYIVDDRLDPDQCSSHLLVAYKLKDGQAPRCVTNRREVRDYLIRTARLAEENPERKAA